MSLKARIERLGPLPGGSPGEVLGVVRLGGEATQPVLLRPVPKELWSEPGRRTQLEQEVQRAADLLHPNLAQPLGLDEVEGGAARIEAWTDGAPLSEVLAAGGRMPPTIAARILADACAGVHFAHEGGDSPVVHGHLRPAILLVSRSGLTRVAGFGAGVVEGARPLRERLPWVSPEQVLGGPGAADRQSDVYLLGLVLYACLAGEPPFASEADVEKAVLEGRPAPLESLGVSRAIAEVVEKATARKASDRHASAAELAQAVRQAAGDLAPPGAVAAWLDVLLPASEGVGAARRAMLAEGAAGQGADSAPESPAQAEPVGDEHIIGTPTPLPLPLPSSVAPAAGVASSGAVPAPQSAVPAAPGPAVPGQVAPAAVAVSPGAVAGPPSAVPAVPGPVAPAAAVASSGAVPAPQSAVLAPSGPVPPPAGAAVPVPPSQPVDLMRTADILMDPLSASRGADLVTTREIVGEGSAPFMVARPPARAAEPSRRSTQTALLAAGIAVAGLAIGWGLARRGEEPVHLTRPAPAAATAPVPAPVQVATPLVIPPPAPSAEPKRGPPAAGPPSVEVTSDPAGEVYLDGKRAGRTPLVKAVSRGRHKVRLVDKASGVDVAKTVDVKAARTPVRFALGKGTLTVTAPEGAVIFLDGRKVGTGRIDDLPVYQGSHRITVRLGQARNDHDFTIGPEQTYTYDVERTSP